MQKLISLSVLFGLLGGGVAMADTRHEARVERGAEIARDHRGERPAAPRFERGRRERAAWGRRGRAEHGRRTGGRAGGIGRVGGHGRVHAGGRGRVGGGRARGRR